MTRQENSRNEGQEAPFALITPLPIVGDGHHLAAAAAPLSNNTDGELKPKIKRDGSNSSLGMVDSRMSTMITKEGPIFECASDEALFESMPPFEGLDGLDEVDSQPKDTDNTLSSPTAGTPSNDANDVEKLDVKHLLQASPISPGSDLEPLPLTDEPFPLSGPIVDDFLSLFDEMSGETSTLTSQHYHWNHHPYHYASYPVPPGFYPHRYAYSCPFHRAPYHVPYNTANPKDVIKNMPHHSSNQTKHSRKSLPYERVHRNLTESVKRKSTIKAKDLTEFDVICGRGGFVNSQPGNKRFRGFINKYKLEYLYASREEKPAVADKVLELVKPGRFIVAMSKDTYAETEEFRAREKASQALREGAAKLRKDGYSEKGYQALKPSPKMKLPHERESREKRRSRSRSPSELPLEYSLDAEYCEAFEPPSKKAKMTNV